jgi:non-specific serine/threonine protein kinase/serine/threonine-protein kinase
MSMDTRVHEKVSLYEKASVKPSVEDLCAGNPELIPTVRECINRIEQMRALSDHAAASPARPACIGPYHVLELLGTGGMGEVYKAERRTPMRQTVAVKVIKPGFDTREVIARFESERQALARMDHPHVAKVLDAGTTEAGRPYFVMEYVAGDPITKFADDNKLTIRDRLLLFSQVCDAIAHAHTKAIIHRDIKEHNVLARLHDGKPFAKVIDFGIAKALTGDRLTDRTFNTERGHAVGTYESMSPEQADGSPDIDTRTDIYSLGVLLYELLTGVKPFDHDTLARAADDEIRRIIREVDPPRPATRLTRLGPSATKIAALRRDGLEHLARELRGELECIPLKCMRKERDRRYSSVQQLNEDIHNYLEHRPLIAAPESRMYRARKYVKRHAREVLVTAAVLMLLVLGLLGTSLGLLIAARHKADAIVSTAGLVTATIERATDHASKGNLDQARKLLEDALDDAVHELGGDHEVTLAAKNNLASVMKSLGDLESSGKLNSEVLEIRRRDFGDDHPLTIASINNLGGVLVMQRDFDDAESLLKEGEVRSLSAYGESHPETLSIQNNLAELFRVQLRLTEAERRYRNVLEGRRRVLGADHRDTLLSLNSLGVCLRDQERFAEAQTLLTDALERRRSVFGNHHPDTIASIFDVGVLMRAMKKLSEAEKYFVEAFSNRRKLFGDANPDTLGARHMLARVLYEQGKHREAEPHFVELDQLVPAHLHIPDMAKAVYLARYGPCLAALQRYSEAEKPLREAHDRLSNCDRSNKTVVNALREVLEALTLVCEKTGRPDEAVKWRAMLVDLDAADGPSDAQPAKATVIHR